MCEHCGQKDWRLLRERSAVVTDENGHWSAEHEPSLEEFEAPEDEVTSRTSSPLARVLRLVGVLILITALLMYFVTPFNNFFTTTTYYLMHPDVKVHPIPAAPKPQASPRFRV
jgi:hypothetical protein